MSTPSELVRQTLLDFHWDNYRAEPPPFEDEDGEDTDLLRDLVRAIMGGLFAAGGGA